MDKYLKIFEPAMKKWLAEHYSPEEAKKRWERTVALDEKWIREEGDLGGRKNAMAIVLRRKGNGMGADDPQRIDDIGRGCDLRLGRFSERLLFFTVFPALCIDLYDLQSLRHDLL